MSSFNAKPSGGYAISSTEGTNNIKVIYNYLHAQGYVDNAIIGILGNVYGESALNPWLWENNTVSYSNGYGLFQFTPASEYINATWIPDWAPNESTSQALPGADPDDGFGQLYALVNDTFGKWLGTCWRSYWDPADYPDLYTKRTYILNTYGDGYGITMNDFKSIYDYSDACFAFLACYEGPLIPNYLTRLGYCADIKPIIDNLGTDIMLLKRIIDIQFHRRFNVL